MAIGARDTVSCWSPRMHCARVALLLSQWSAAAAGQRICGCLMLISTMPRRTQLTTLTLKSVLQSMHPRSRSNSARLDVSERTTPVHRTPEGAIISNRWIRRRQSQLTSHLVRRMLVAESFSVRVSPVLRSFCPCRDAAELIRRVSHRFFAHCLRSCSCCLRVPVVHLGATTAQQQQRTDEQLAAPAIEDSQTTDVAAAEAGSASSAPVSVVGAPADAPPSALSPSADGVVEDVDEALRRMCSNSVKAIRLYAVGRLYGWKEFFDAMSVRR